LTRGKVTALRGELVTLQAAAAAFLSSPRMSNPNTRRAYAGAIDRVMAELGPGALLAEVADEQIGNVLQEAWGGAAPSTWNRNRAAISSWLTWCRTKKRWPAPSVPTDAERRKENADETRALEKATIERLLTRRCVRRRWLSGPACGVPGTLATRLDELVLLL
jgi:hypothetical protein